MRIFRRIQLNSFKLLEYVIRDRLSLVSNILQAYVETFVVRAFYEGVLKASAHSSLAPVFEQLFQVFAIHTIRNQALDFIRVRHLCVLYI